MTTDRNTSATGCPAGADRLESLAGVSFIDPAIQEKPFAYYRALREGDPVHYEDELGMYLVSRHEDLWPCFAIPSCFPKNSATTVRWLTAISMR